MLNNYLFKLKNLFYKRSFSKREKYRIAFSSGLGILIATLTSFIVNATLAEISFNTFFSLVILLISPEK